MTWQGCLYAPKDGEVAHGCAVYAPKDGIQCPIPTIIHYSLLIIHCL